MGRIQPKTNVPYPPPQPYPPPPPPLNQPHPNTHYQQDINGNFMANHNINLQQAANVTAVPQYQYQWSPVVTPPAHCLTNAAQPSAPYNAAATTPGPVTVPLPKNGAQAAWTTGLFDCMQDPTNALITGLFPCVTFGQIADVLDNGHTTCATSGIIYAFAPCLVSRPYRKKLRQRFGLVEAPASDWIVHSMFEYCSLCQEYRELNNRGIDPALGYHGNMNKHLMVPPQNQMMK